jgi:two-component system sensor histidine kinase VanS
VKTIRAKLTCIFMIFMVSLVLICIMLNSIFLESYYIYKNKNILVLKSEKVKYEYINNKENNYEYADAIQSIDNINTVITDKDFNIKYNSLQQKSNKEEKQLSKEMKQTILENKKAISEEYLYYSGNKNKNQRRNLILISQINNGDIIILRKSYKGILESVSIANEFYIIASCIVIFTSVIFIFIFSRRITGPIVEMSKVTENISDLKFDKLVNVTSEDEIGVLGISINKISDKLNKSINELKLDVEQKKEFIRNMSHELKTPIGIIKGYAEGLKYGVVNDKDKMNKYCSILVEECDRMDKLVKELLNYSMMEGGIIKLKITNFDIYELVSNIINRFNPLLDKGGIKFNLNCNRNSMISADKDMLEKAINNYIINAINHAGGSKNINITVEEKENKMKISVFNTGDNISEEELNKIWDVCYKVDKARSRRYGGHGIGLSIVRLIVELHNGISKVENAEDGVKFSFEIPKMQNN